MKSIRFYLIATILAAMTLLVFLSALHGYNKSTLAAKNLLDKQLIYTANILSSLPVSSNTNNDLEHYIIRSNTLTNSRAFQVWHNNHLISRSSNAPETPISTLETGFHTSNFNQYRWRTYTQLNSDTQHRVITAERTDIRNRLIDNLIIQSALPVIITLPVAAVFIWFLIGSGLQPVRRLSEQLQQKQAHDLSPVSLYKPVNEVQPLVYSVNNLLARLKSAFEREKHFSADAAHELRTPISILKIDLYNLQAEFPDNNKLQPLLTSVERMGHLVEQILTLYRTTPAQYLEKFEPIDLYQSAQDSVAQQYPYFDSKNQQIELLGSCSMISSDRFLLETLLQNLLSNASKYTPANGRIEISVTTDKHGAQLKIEDSGPGIPEDKYQRIFDRFYRLHGDQNNSSIEGCGLGLSIVKHIVELHHGEIHLSHSHFKSGLAVSIHFPVSH